MLERLVRGFSNHRRIQLLESLDRTPEQSVMELSRALKTQFKTIAQHVQRLAQAGLVLKRSDGHSVRHKLSQRGNLILKFLRTIE
ncbi:MAG: hypothetical protein AAB955_00120 [Patescibacteria group bacterium]